MLLVACLFGLHAEATAAAHTSTYVFVPEQSKVVQTGGFANVHWTYSIKGHFQLTVDQNLGSASFANVDANATDDSSFQRILDPNHVFNMTSLVGTVEPNGSIKFTGNAPDDSAVSITVTLQDNLAHLIGQTTPPPHSADFFIFSLDAVAQLRKYGGGSGTADDPYQIATAEDLFALGETPEDYDKHFKLMADIDLSGYTYERAVIAPDTNDVEDGFQGKLFTGVLDGNGHAISRLRIDGTSYLGLFGHIDAGARISNLGLEQVDINGTGHFVGGLLGRNGRTHHQLSGHIANCYSKGVVRVSEGDVGGLVGFNTGWITASSSFGTVSGSYRVGGLVGWNQGPVIDSYSLCMVTGESGVGGLIGGNGHFALFGGPGEIFNCFSAGSVRGVLDVGGFVGSNSHGEAVNCLWDIETSGVPDMCGSQGWPAAGCDDSYGKTTTEMQTASTFLEAGWDFVNVWAIGENQTYPYLRKYSAADINQDASVNFLDLAALADNWLTGGQ